MADDEDIPLDVQGYLSITGTFYFLLFDLSLTPFYLPKTPSSQFLFCSVVAHSPALFLFSPFPVPVFCFVGSPSWCSVIAGTVMENGFPVLRNGAVQITTPFLRTSSFSSGTKRCPPQDLSCGRLFPSPSRCSIIAATVTENRISVLGNGAVNFTAPFPEHFLPPPSPSGGNHRKVPVVDFLPLRCGAATLLPP